MGVCRERGGGRIITVPESLSGQLDLQRSSLWCVLYHLPSHSLSVQRTGNPDAELTVEEIQNAIDKANTQTLEAIECK